MRLVPITPLFLSANFKDRPSLCNEVLLLPCYRARLVRPPSGLLPSMAEVTLVTLSHCDQQMDSAKQMVGVSCLLLV